MTSDYWLGFALGLAVGMVLTSGESKAAELRIVTPKRTGTWQMVSNNACVKAVERIKVNLIKPARFFCDGRKV